MKKKNEVLEINFDHFVEYMEENHLSGKKVNSKSDYNMWIDRYMSEVLNSSDNNVRSELVDMFPFEP